MKIIFCKIRIEKFTEGVDEYYDFYLKKMLHKKYSSSKYVIIKLLPYYGSIFIDISKKLNFPRAVGR